VSRPDDRLDAVETELRRLREIEKHQKLFESNIRDLTARNDALIGQIRSWRLLLGRASYDLADRLRSQGKESTESHLWCDLRNALLDDITRGLKK
jgi:hypothetical protein